MNDVVCFVRSVEFKMKLLFSLYICSRAVYSSPYISILL